MGLGLWPKPGHPTPPPKFEQHHPCTNIRHARASSVARERVGGCANSAPAPRAELTRAHRATTEPDPHAHEPAARPNRVPDELIDGGSVSLELSRCRRRRLHGGPPPPPATPLGSERSVHPRAATAVRPCPPPHLRVACMVGASAAAAWPALPAGPCSRRSACLQVQVTVHRPAQPNPRPDNQRRGQGTRLGPAPRAPRGLLRPGAVDGQGDRDRVGRCAPHPPSRACCDLAHM